MSLTPSPGFAGRDRWLVVGVVAAGLVTWFAYCAVQPHDFWSGSTLDRATLFGWDAPGFPTSASDVPDRLWIVWVGWALISLLAGSLWPEGWPLIAVCTVMPAWIIYIPTAPRSDDGLWMVGVVTLPFTIIGFAAFAWLAGTIRSSIATQHSSESTP